MEAELWEGPEEFLRGSGMSYRRESYLSQLTQSHLWKISSDDKSLLIKTNRCEIIRIFFRSTVFQNALELLEITSSLEYLKTFNNFCPLFQIV